jgi:hypothetical protein
LAHFPFSQVHDHPRQEFDDFEIVKVCQVPTGLGEEKIACQHGHPVIEAAVDRGDASTGGGLIHDIIVNQGGGVDHFGDLGQAPVPGTESAVWGDGFGEQQNNAWPQALTACSKKMFSRRLQDGMAGTNETAKFGQKSVQVGLNRL